jgi:membrane-bound lytic murein transglycosylase B
MKTGFAWTAITGALIAATLAAPARALDIESYPDVEGFIQDFAQRNGYPEERLRTLFTRVLLRDDIVPIMERPKEGLPWHEYRKMFVTDDHIKRGTEFWSRHERVLARASGQYGVPAEIIVAILGIETQYGRNTGEFPLIDALTTLWLQYPPRAAFFRTELEELLLLAREIRADPLMIKGSYAGAMGMPQFIPSSYRRYAVDFNGDQRRDLFKNIEDIIGSVANFLKEHGWEDGAPIVDDAQLHGTKYFWIERLGVKPALRIDDLLDYGIAPRTHTDADRRAALLSFESEAGPFYLVGYNNFFVITRYNRSKRYAMAVVELADRLRRNRNAP